MTLNKPTIDFPEGAAPSELEIKDIVVGDGDEATAGRQVVVHYVGVAHSTGEEFDAS
ncbi:MAG TPA: peptidylprolyl isomerase, partial [Micromonosporaceae bacterium]|nr:peptidylprolyl isomerase [Micromonosporaceae bacterium]